MNEVAAVKTPEDCAFEVLAALLENSQRGTCHRIELKSKEKPSIKIVILDYSKKAMLNYAEAIEVMRDGGKVRVFNLGENHRWLEYLNEQGGRLGIYEMVGDELVVWNPKPTIQDLLMDCFVVV